ncbi:hypothetical protein Q3G72_013775 [Acer saccharum]|nr:hypothetical protein Q3G72_013775 [Acer saccharum]
MKSNEFLAGGSVRVRGKNVSFNAVDVIERLETMSYPQWADGYEPSKFYEMHTITLGPAVLLYLMKMELPFDVGIVAIKMIAEAGRTNVPNMSFLCLITYFCERAGVRFDAEDEWQDGGVVGTKAYNEAAIPRGFPKLESEKSKKRRLQREKREAKKVAAAVGIGTGKELEPEHYTPPPAYEPGPSSHPHPFDPAVEFQTMLPYSPTALIPYPTPLSVAKPTRDQSDLDAIDSETSLD